MQVPSLECTVSLLSCFEPASKWDDWVIGQHGLIIKFREPSFHGHPESGCMRSATFLPEVYPESNRRLQILSEGNCMNDVITSYLTMHHSLLDSSSGLHIGCIYQYHRCVCINTVWKFCVAVCFESLICHRANSTLCYNNASQVAAEQGWTHQQCIDALIQKSGCTIWPITEELRRSLHITRYQSTTCTLTHQEFLNTIGTHHSP